MSADPNASVKRPLDFCRFKQNREIDKLLGIAIEKKETEDDKRKKRLDKEAAERARDNERVIQSYALRKPGTGSGAK